MPERLIANASPIIFLARVRGLEWLSLHSRAPVGVPDRVCEEIEVGGDGASVLNAIEHATHFEILDNAVIPSSVLAWDLGPGESQVLSHCAEQAGYVAVIDDRAARQCARSHAISVVGTLGIVLATKQHGTIPSARAVIEELLKEGLYLSPSLVSEALASVGE